MLGHVLAACEEDAARHEKVGIRGAEAENRANHVETAEVHGGCRRLRIIGQHEREDPAETVRCLCDGVGKQKRFVSKFPSRRTSHAARAIVHVMQTACPVTSLHLEWSPAALLIADIRASRETIV